MRSSIPLFDAIAADYDAHWDVIHRRAYDQLAWELVEPMLPPAPGCVIDAGCGNGRWAERIVGLGHRVVAVEQAPSMAATARARLRTRRFDLIEASMEEIDLTHVQADVTLALGSLQYTGDPERMIGRLAAWTRVGGSVVVLVDSLLALVLELLAADRADEALQRLTTRIGTWSQREQQADNHQLDRDRLVAAFARAGLTDIRPQGLLVGASSLGLARLLAKLDQGWERQLALERRLAQSPLLADLGKQLLVSGRRAAVADLRAPVAAAARPGRSEASAEDRGQKTTA